MIIEGLVSTLANQTRVKLSQSQASLEARGVDKDRAQELAPHLVMPGSRPSSVITMASLTPNTLGALLALYEHRTFVSSQLWGINPFDQWGVELGKILAKPIEGELNHAASAAAGQHDASTASLIARARAALGNA